MKNNIYDLALNMGLIGQNIERNEPVLISNFANDKNFQNTTKENLSSYKEFLDNFDNLYVDVVTKLPTENISSTTLYLIKNDMLFDEYIYYKDSFVNIGTLAFNIRKFLSILSYIISKNLKSSADKSTKNLHTHINKDTLDKLSESENGDSLLFDGKEIQSNNSINDIKLSEDNDNAIVRHDDGLYAKDFSKDINELNEKVNAAPDTPKDVDLSNYYTKQQMDEALKNVKPTTNEIDISNTGSNALIHEPDGYYVADKASEIEALTNRVSELEKGDSESNLKVSTKANNAIKNETDGIYVEDLTERVQALENNPSSGSIDVDTKVSDESNNPISNKAIKEYVDNQFRLSETGLSEADLQTVRDDVKKTLEDHTKQDIYNSEGIHGIRVINNTFQTYNKTKDTWEDVQYFDNNNNKGAHCSNPTHVSAVSGDKKATIYWEDPEPNYKDGYLLAVWKGTKLVMKEGSYPEDENDGTLIVDNEIKNKYRDKGYEITGLKNNTNYYFTLFPYSDMGKVTNDIANRFMCRPKDYTIYAMHINGNESDPDYMITYPEGYDNSTFSPAYMDFDKDEFNYGSWQKAFFMPRSCMLKYDGTVDYYLDERNNELKEDGTKSDIANVDYEGNAMMEWGKFYWKIVPDEGDDTSATFIISDKQVDKDGNVDYDMMCWSNYDCNGNEIPHFYTYKYFGSYDGTRLRSLSGQNNDGRQTFETNIERSLKNNLTESVEWYTDVYCDYILIQMLTLLIIKSTNSQNKLGTGIGDTRESYILQPGTLDKNGLFYGKNSFSVGVKLFGMENFYGNINRRISGVVVENDLLKFKLTFSDRDGSETSGYNINGTGYIVKGSLSSLSSNSYIKSFKYDKYVLIPNEVAGSSATYYCDCCRKYLTTGCVLVGGDYDYSIQLGLNSISYGFPPNSQLGYIGTALSCKPIKKGDTK